MINCDFERLKFGLDSVSFKDLYLVLVLLILKQIRVDFGLRVELQVSLLTHLLVVNQQILVGRIVFENLFGSR